MGEIQTTEYEGIEIRARGHEALFTRKPATVAATQEAMDAGTILGQVTESGLFVAYDDDAIDGSEVAAGILLEDVDAVSAGAAVVSSMYVKGAFVESKLTGLDDAAKADLGARSVPGHVLTPTLAGRMRADPDQDRRPVVPVSCLR